jgi:hypothetical protein
MRATDPTPRLRENVPHATSSDYRPASTELLELLGVLGFVLLFWCVRLLVAD